MEEKERYSYDYFIDGAVFIDTENDRDMDMDTVCSLLNKQNKHIKELEEENKELKDFTENTANLIDKLTEDSVFASTQLAIEELKKLKENAWQSATDISQLIDYTELAKIIDNQIKELGGKEK